jgi:exodeoxyribonuclease VII large subunit
VTVQILPVGALVDILRLALDADPLFSDLWVTGEVVSASVVRGHCYLTLADQSSQLRGVVFSRSLQRQAQHPRAGMQVAVHGKLDVYPGRGELQIVIDSVQPAGLGLAALEFERLRAQLEAEGLFDPARKRPIPERPRVIGVVTSESGAVWHDIQNVLRRRYPLARLLLAAARVQGDQAPDTIVRALRALQDDGRPDVIIVARGGGSPEDLAAFNSEAVVRAVFASRIPVVSGVGHETDVTLIDLVADLRAPTPSAAAELCTPSLAEDREHVHRLRRYLERAAQQSAADRHLAVAANQARLVRLHPTMRIEWHREQLALSRRALRQATGANYTSLVADVREQRAKLVSLDPDAVLARGYSVLTGPDSSRPISRVADLAAGMAVEATVADGRIKAWVTGTETVTSGKAGATTS